MRTIKAADLFCGAGGTSTGLYKAADALGASMDLLAVDHWSVAIATHGVNHKEALHLCETLDGVNPRKVIRGGRLNLLVASPECTHHSNARGGRPMNDQSRASAWHVIRWAEALIIDNILVENVREFLNWGPLGVDGRPLKSRRGETFLAWVAALESLNYRVEHRILNAANYGDPTTRERLFVIARRGRKPIAWPKQSHSKDKNEQTAFGLKPWVAAREIIDWTDHGESIFNRKRPLAPNTIRRIGAGLRKFSGLELEPFLVKLYGTATALSSKAPVPTVTGGGGHVGIAEPFLIGQQSGAAPRSADDPVPTVAGAGAISKVEPFIAEFHGGKTGHERVRKTDVPLPVVDCSPRFGLIQPFMISAGGPEVGPRSVEDPAHTVLTRDHIGIAQPFIVGAGGPSGTGKPRSVKEPLGTVMAENHRAVIIPVTHADRVGATERAHGIEQPLPTVTCARRGELAIVQAFLVQYNGTADARDINEPVGTLTAKPRYALLLTLADGRKMTLDIRFRMLRPRELARAQGFPDSYEFTGKTDDIVKQIGNAVPVNLAQALCMAVLS